MRNMHVNIPVFLVFGRILGSSVKVTDRLTRVFHKPLHFYKGDGFGANSGLSADDPIELAGPYKGSQS